MSAVMEKRKRGRPHGPSGRRSSALTDRDYLVNRAGQLVFKAVRAGDLLPLHLLKCIDCGAQAECYDHRDYRKPLEVEPVCKGCNNRRGPGLPYPEKIDGSYTKRIGGAAGYKNSNFGIEGEGYSPTEFLCHAELPREKVIGNELYVDPLTCSAAVTVLDRIALLGRTGKKTFASENWFARSMYFKERDPWRHDFF